MDALALPFTGAYSQFDVSDGQEHVGIWYYRPESGLEYVFGPIEERFDAISVLDTQTSEEDGLLRVVVQGGRYAVFSYPRPEDDRDIPSM